MTNNPRWGLSRVLPYELRSSIMLGFVSFNSLFGGSVASLTGLRCHRSAYEQPYRHCT
jgi:hypothetical protein